MNSRIQKSIMNAKVNTIFYVLMLVLAFFSRKYFLQNLGKEFVGLTGTLGDMLNLMNITELGVTDDEIAALRDRYLEAEAAQPSQPVTVPGRPEEWLRQWRSVICLYRSSGIHSRGRYL